ncbi:MAG: YecA family protein [Alcanivoracaceae bacterium]|nr:YecA family protein [Alcanivoracaceae bacterium]
MTDTDSDLFQPLAEALSHAGVRHSPSELHGVICGLLSTGIETEAPELLGVLASHVDLTDSWPARAADLLVGLRDQAVSAFDGDGLDLALLLPDDDEELALRVAALGQWCEGFLTGFGTGSAGVKDAQLAPSLQEAIADLAAVSQVDVPDGDGEEEEALLSQVTEHCRMAALMVFTEWQLKARVPAKSEGPVTKH